MSAFGLYLFVICIAIGGIAVDYSSALRTETQLQAAADSAAHAALVARQSASEEEAILAGIEMAHATLPASLHGAIIQPSDFVFGQWDRETGTFTPVSGSRDAVLVDTARAAQRANALQTLFLRIIGIRDFDVMREAIYETYVPRCVIEGFMSDVLVDVTSVNIYREGYCIHSNGAVELQNNSIFEPGTIVSMPSLDDLDIPTAGMTSNIGLAEALRHAYYDIGVSERIAVALANVNNLYAPMYHPDLLTSSTSLHVTASNNFDEAEWTEGRVNEAECMGANGRLRIRNGTTLRNGVLYTNCRIVFGEGVNLQDVVIITTSTHRDSITGAAGVVLGRDDDCAPGGGVQIFTRGGVSFPSSLSMFGTRIIAEQEVRFTALADAVQGSSILSNGPIYGTANGEAAICGGDAMPADIGRRYFRLAR
ncbi:hypothetical protein HKCCSP123_05400 [Rhodobacterales bacterium HKCCSP123]|nr:hypothetical protein [Rhodobacterales bacterium HKCCSP123]